MKIVRGKRYDYHPITYEQYLVETHKPYGKDNLVLYTKNSAEQYLHCDRRVFANSSPVLADLVKSLCSWTAPKRLIIYEEYKYMKHIMRIIHGKEPTNPNQNYEAHRVEGCFRLAVKLRIKEVVDFFIPHIVENGLFHLCWTYGFSMQKLIAHTKGEPVLPVRESIYPTVAVFILGPPSPCREINPAYNQRAEEISLIENLHTKHLIFDIEKLNYCRICITDVKEEKNEARREKACCCFGL